jgi:thiamine-monophosphate kinase
VVHPKQVPDKGDRLPTGEDAVLERIRTRLRTGSGPPRPGETWSGDDAAVLWVGEEGKRSRLLLTTDAVLGGVHVDLGLVTLADVGWKALTVAVSDVAAMGGLPTGAVVTLGVPPDTDVDHLAEGMTEAAARWGCPVVGGDLTSAAQLVVSTSVIGRLEGEAPAVLRSGARPGDTLYVTGALGASAAGLRVLREDPASADAALAAAYRRPEARIGEGRAARAAGATAMMDVSDGLGLDLHRLADASGVGFALDRVPIAEGATLEEALGGGEDYELVVATSDPAVLEDAFAAHGLRAPVRIGVCLGEVRQRDLGGEPLAASGYEHRI